MKGNNNDDQTVPIENNDYQKGNIPQQQYEHTIRPCTETRNCISVEGNNNDNQKIPMECKGYQKQIPQALYLPVYNMQSGCLFYLFVSITEPITIILGILKNVIIFF